MAHGDRERLRLLNRVADHILTDGATDVSLSELARRIESNNRMLLYYFGSREKLLDEAVLLAYARFPRIYSVLERLSTSREPLPVRFERAWTDISHPENVPFLRLFFERFGVVLQQPQNNAEVLERLGNQWASQVQGILISEGHDRQDALISATGIVSLWRGLQFALLSGTSRETLDATHQRILGHLICEPHRDASSHH